MNTTPETLVVEQADFAAAQEWINTPCSAAEEVLASATDSMDMQGRQMTLAFMAGAQHARLATLSSKGRGEDAELERLICAIIEDAPSASDEEGHFHGGAYLPAARQILASLDPTPEPCSPVAREGEEAECPFVAGPACNDGECWTAEVQIVGGHYVVATVHGATEQEARERQAAIINALAQTPPALSGGGELREGLAKAMFEAEIARAVSCGESEPVAWPPFPEAEQLWLRYAGHALAALAQSTPAVGEGYGYYVASRATVAARPAMWRALREQGVPINSTWIDEAGDGETACFTELWERIKGEIARSSALILYAEAGDFPLKGALTEAGIAIGMGKRVAVVTPGVDYEARSYRPIGSWVSHPLVTRFDTVAEALAALPLPVVPHGGGL